MVPHAPAGARDTERKLKLDYSTPPVMLRIVLPPPEQDEMKAVERASDKGPLVVGFHRDMPEGFEGDLAPRLEWIAQQDGTFVSVISVTSPGAAALRVGLRTDAVAGIEIRFFSEQSGAHHPPLTSEDFQREGDESAVRWSPTVAGDTIGIEIALPSKKAVSAFSFSVERVAHAFPSMASIRKADKLECPDVHIDVQCRVGRIHDNGQDAVARIRFENEGLSFECSGTLMNDKVRGSAVPYFLTANHCVPTGAVASSVEASWFFQRASCGGTALDRRHATTTGGGDLLATNSDYDLTLLRLREAPPGGSVLSGWSRDALEHPAGVYGIHHPDGGVKKYSAGTTKRIPGTPEPASAILVTWSEGTTEPGSSGSGLFLRNGGYLVGGLSGGEDCGAGTSDVYGALQGFFPQVSRWLDSESPAPPDDDHGDTARTATLVRAPSSTGGNLERYGDRDYFRIDLGRDGPLWVYTTGATDTYGTLTRAGSDSGWEDDDSGTDENFLIIAREAQAGTWYVEVRGFDSGTTGVYTLHAGLSGPRLPPDHALPLVTAASNLQVQGFVRVINLSGRAGTVRIHAIDDAGRRFGPVSLSLEARESSSFNSRDLEEGNSAVGLPGGVGDGTGDWRLELHTDLAIEARAYIRTADGFLTSMHEVAEETAAGSMRYYVPFFNPASNRSLVSRLRLINPGDADAAVVIEAVDARGDPSPEGEVRLTLPAGAARTLSAQQLERGGSGLSGRLGDGQGKWRLYVSANRPLQVMGLMRTRSGHLSNLSR